MYSTYEDECEAAPTDRKKVMVLGGGPNRIGQGIEFDYCCVHAAMALREDGFETIMVNCNPETVSTDYDTSDRLYFEPLTLEDVLEIVHVEKPWGVIVQFGGQTPLKLARDLEANGVPIIGTSPDMIDMAEDRERFQQMLHRLELKQPPNRTARTKRRRSRPPRRSAIRWSCGRRTCSAAARWRSCTSRATSSATCAKRSRCRNDSPVLLDRFLNDAIEVDVDAVCDGTDVDHRRHHGAHRAGRRALGRLGVLAAAVLAVAPSCRTSCAGRRSRWRRRLHVVGLMNVQFAIQTTRQGRSSTCSKSIRARRARCRSCRRRRAGRSRRSPRAAWSAQTLKAQGVTRRDRAAATSR